MIALQMEYVRDFMNKLLLTPVFDDFLVSESTITTFTTFTIEGQLRREFYAPDEFPEGMDPESSQVTWAMIRPFCLQIFKGKRLPLSFRIVLQLSAAKTAVLLEENDLNIAPEDIFGLFLNIQYRGGTLTLTTGSSLRVFSMDRSLDQAWDRSLKEFLAASGLE